jgi:serine protease
MKFFRCPSGGPAIVAKPVNAMRIRASLTAGAVATVAAITFAVPGIAAAASDPALATTSSTAAGPAGAPAATAPQSAFENASGHVTTGKVLGVIPSRGASSKTSGIVKDGTGLHGAAAAPAACTEPNCNLTYDGGPVQDTPRVYVVFWGPKWNTSAATSAKNYITGLFAGIGLTGKGDFWSGIVKQYGGLVGQPNNTSVLAGTWVDTADAPPSSNPSTAVTMDTLAAVALDASVHFNVPRIPIQDDIVIASQQGTCFAPLDSTDPTSTFAGNCGTPQPSGNGYCAFHSSDGLTLGTQYLPWISLPYQPDAQANCGQGFAPGFGANAGFSINGARELMETITDPIGDGWNDLGDTVDTTDNVYGGGEIGDKCLWAGSLWNQNPPDPIGNITLNGGSYAMQSLWSNAAGGCVMTGALGLKITTPAAQSSIPGTAISPVQIQASTTDPTPLTYSATGLPPGVSINKTTGVISGTPVTAGTFTTRVTVAYYYSSGTVTFTWKVASTPGQIKGWASKCVADYQAKTTAGAKIVLWPCAAAASMNITFGANNQLSVVGTCITGTTTVFIEPCSAAGAKYQHWTRLSNGEYVLQSNGECLTAPGQANGLQLVMAACKNTGNQRWGLP